MRRMHGAWQFGVDATEQELETANAAMEELERLGAHSADVIARWMRVHGIHGVKGDTEQCPLTLAAPGHRRPTAPSRQVPRHRLSQPRRAVRPVGRVADR